MKSYEGVVFSLSVKWRQVVSYTSWLFYHLRYLSNNCTAGWTVLWTILLLCVISGFCHRVNEIFIFLGYDVALISSSLRMLQDNLSVPSAWDKWSKKNAGNSLVHSYMGNGVGSEWFSENMMTGCPKTSVTNHQSTLYNI